MSATPDSNASSPPPPARVLVVDDEPDVLDLIAYQLIAKGIEPLCLGDPAKVMEMARIFRPDLIILDIMMPSLGGIELCRRLKADAGLGAVPILFLSARSEENDRCLGLESGAEDYLCKPFSPRELMLRVNKILARAPASRPAPAIPGDVFESGPLRLDVQHHEVTVDGRRLDLTAMEFRLLHTLIERKGRVQSRDQLLNSVWGMSAEVETRTVDTHVRRLRAKLGDHSRLVQTVHGVGYRLVRD
ncbi:MAG: DNA-binding response regulator [Puniceicoccaceae bacterium]|nr:MAG: DNA-binding response regulator [Puniceicoccaceae bacterium]